SAGQQTGAPASLVGAAHAPKRASGAVDAHGPYDVRSLPAQAPKYPYSSVRSRGTQVNKATAKRVTKQVSAVPKSTSGSTGAQRLPILPQPKRPQVILYDQYNNASATGSLSATFTDFPTYSSDLA